MNSDNGITSFFNGKTHRINVKTPNEIDYLEELDRSRIKVQIGDMEGYWHKIKRPAGIEGWTYGYFLDLVREESIIEN